MADYKHSYQQSKSWKKPKGESHQWTYDKTCESVQAAIEERWGVDYRIVDIQFVDNGRSTKTKEDWQRRSTWRCTHTVTANYNTERRGLLTSLQGPEDEYRTERFSVEYKMLNELHSKYTQISPDEVLSDEIPDDTSAKGPTIVGNG